MNLLQLWWLSKMYIWVFPKIGGTPQIIHFNRVFQFKPSILGYPYFWKHPYVFSSYLPLVTNLSGPIKGQTGSHVRTCKNREPSEYHVCTLPISQLRFKTLENSFTVTPWESTKGLWLTCKTFQYVCLVILVVWVSSALLSDCPASLLGDWSRYSSVEPRDRMTFGSFFQSLVNYAQRHVPNAKI